MGPLHTMASFSSTRKPIDKMSKKQQHTLNLQIEKKSLTPSADLFLLKIAIALVILNSGFF